MGGGDCYWVIFIMIVGPYLYVQIDREEGWINRVNEYEIWIQSRS